jgi:S1-C subfamily serine protease
VPRLIRDGRMVRPALGVTAGPEAMTRGLNLPPGVPLVQVTPGGPAAKAGLQPFTRGREGGIVAGDVITAINGEPVKSLDDLLTVLERLQPGDAATVTLSRAGKERKEKVTLGTSTEE